MNILNAHRKYLLGGVSPVAVLAAMPVPKPKTPYEPDIEAFSESGLEATLDNISWWGARAFRESEDKAFLASLAAMPLPKPGNRAPVEAESSPLETNESYILRTYGPAPIDDPHLTRAKNMTRAEIDAYYGSSR